MNQNRLPDRYLSIDQSAIGEYFRLAVRIPAVELPSQNYFHSDDETVILSHSHQNRHSRAGAPGRECQIGYPSDTFSLLVGRGNALRNIRQARGLVSFAVLMPVSHNFLRAPILVRTLLVQRFQPQLSTFSAASKTSAHLTKWADSKPESEVHGVHLSDTARHQKSVKANSTGASRHIRICSRRLCDPRCCLAS